MPTIVTANGARVRCEAHKAWAVVVETPPHAVFTGRFEDGKAVWQDVPLTARVIFRTNDREALVRRVNAERNKISRLSGPLVDSSVGIFHLPTKSWTVPIRERITVAEHVAAGR
jgi:hypothetical protein